MAKVRMDKTPRSTDCNRPASLGEVEEGLALAVALILGEAVVVMELEEPSEFFSVLTIPPCIWAGTSLVGPLAAALLNAARVSGPLELGRVSILLYYSSCLHDGLILTED